MTNPLQPAIHAAQRMAYLRPAENASLAEWRDWWDICEGEMDRIEWDLNFKLHVNWRSSFVVIALHEKRKRWQLDCVEF